MLAGVSAAKFGRGERDGGRLYLTTSGGKFSLFLSHSVVVV